MNSSFPIATSALYIDKLFDKDIIKHTEEIIENIKEQYIATLEDLKWMDKKTKKSALDKAESMVQILGFPEELTHNDKLEEIYNGVW